MAFYSDTFNKGNISGQHTFDGTALKGLSGYEYSAKASHPDGVVIELKQTLSQSKVADALLHKNGRQGLPNEDLDTLVMDVASLAALPDDLQDQLFQFERVPIGISPTRYRKDAEEPK